MFHSNSSSLLELEAADYFKLDPAHVCMLCNSSSAVQKESSSTKPSANACSIEYQPEKVVQTGSKSGSPRGKSKCSMMIEPRLQSRKQRGPQSISNQASEQRRSASDRRMFESELSSKNSSDRQQAKPSYSSATISDRPGVKQKGLKPEHQLNHSSTTSTNSLPSISTSPSISPSLVCPHLTLDDILNGRYITRSPHTIGLCDKCKLIPPPNIHSPLSPVFKPSATITSGDHQVPRNKNCSDLGNEKQLPVIRDTPNKSTRPIRRGYSDFQARTKNFPPSSMNKKFYKEDSLDFYIDPIELRRSQMSPIQRNSVEFIRKYSTEVGRVMKVYKNGQAFERPLRICITRGEFANLNQLLDHINSRQLIPCGARYLFHLDGQLVYSVNELKHGSSYVVSGTRNFDAKASAVIKEQQMKELNQAHHLHEQLLQRRLLDRRSSRSLGSLGQLARADDSSEAAVSSYNNSKATKEQPTQVANFGQQTETAMRPKMSRTKVEDDIGSVGDLKSRDTQALAKRPTSKSSINRGANRQMKQQTTVRVEQKSRSSENLNRNKLYATNGSKERGSNLSKAKSELSSSALKRKKNVTFMDTGQMSSPIMMRQTSREDEPKKESTSGDLECKDGDGNKKVANNTRNEIDIQVSDSIDGFLIDLPLALPKRGDEKREQEESLHRRRFVTTRRSTNKPSNKTDMKKTKKIVTITERDLSFDELDQLKDLDHGDHHNELHKVKHVIIKLDSADASTSTNDNDSAANQALPDAIPETGERVATGEIEDTTNIEQVTANEEGPIGSLVTKTEDKTIDGESDRWQYPGGHRSSATPEERPVSQNEANGVVRARVTTPTPSLSTVGDNNSLSMSYDGAHQQTDRIKPPADEHKNDIGASELTRVVLPAKNRTPVMGKLSDGLEAPSKNFKLIWVNGFTINDLYPGNSLTLVDAIPTDPVTDSTSAKNSQRAELLSPTSKKPIADEVRQTNTVQFKPSERFRNWICHSRLHDELIYPAGCLIVLWCRWTDEQRHYSRHLTNVSAINLAPTKPDVVASAEVGNLQATSGALIHLWSSTSLETLMIIDEPAHLRGSRIFSLSLRKLTAEQSWSLLIGSRDDNQKQTGSLQLLYIEVDLLLAEKVGDSHNEPEVVSKSTILRANRALQSNQLPLLVTHVPIDNDISCPKTTTGQLTKRSAKSNQARGMLLSFGRRHFQVWTVDWPRQKLQLMQASEKNDTFAELISRSSCLARLAPNEFILGDSTGSITLIIVRLSQEEQIASKTLQKLASPLKSSSSNKYHLEIIRLVDQQPETDNKESSSHYTPGSNLAITSLSRISGSIFASGHSNCMVKFWKIDRARGEPKLTCRQLTCISLPTDLGFICSIVSSGFDRKQSIVEFYLISTSNAILFGSIQLALLNGDHSKMNILDHSSLSVVYEGHETSVMNLVADSSVETSGKNQDHIGHYFTCSLDFKICKWSGKSLIWKSMLPSAGVSLAVHPTGAVLAIGSVDGTVYILDKISGLLISYFPLTPVCINCLSYSQDGSLLAAGCSNGSIFILPVKDNGLKYKKVSIFQSPFPVVSLQFSLDNRYLLTSVTHSQYQDLILWDLPNFRYMRDNVKMVADKINWFEPVCSGSEDVRAIWENINLTPETLRLPSVGDQKPVNKLVRKRLSTVSMTDQLDQQQLVVNLSCHRLIEQDQTKESLCIASDTRGYLRLFRYPCRDIEQAFYQARVTSSRLNCCRFLAPTTKSFVTSALDGSIFLWSLE